MAVREITAKTILSKSEVYDYALNPYVGCMHDCAYCYAKFMKRFTGHRERWGDFVDVKVNAPQLLEQEIQRKKAGRVWVSGVCDPYQPVERRYLLTRRCLAILTEHGWPFTIQTKSPLAVRDIDIIRHARDAEAGFTITTGCERMRKIFEPGAPPIMKRLEALEKIHSAGIRTFVMIAPLLPGAEGLIPLLKGKTETVLVDRLNYHYADWAYRKYGLRWALEDGFFRQKAQELKTGLEKEGISCQVLF